MSSLDAIKKKLQDLQTRGKSRSTKIWRPTDEHDIRAVARPGEDDPFVEVMFHANIGDAWAFPCPGDDVCPICSLCEKLRRWKDDDGNDRPADERKVDWEIFRKIQPRPRFYLQVVERVRENNRPEVISDVRWWSMTEFVYKQLLAISLDDDCNADRDDKGFPVLTDPVTGYDVHVSHQKAGEKGNNTSFDNSVCKERKKPSKLGDDAAIARVASQAELIPPDEVTGRKELAEIERMLDRWVNSGMKFAEKPGKTTTFSKKDDDVKTATAAPSNNGESARTSSGVEDAQAKFQAILDKRKKKSPSADGLPT